MEKDFRSHEEITGEILSRYSVTDLREQTEADLIVGDMLFYKAKTPTDVIAKGETNMVRWWKIMSGDSFYECRRFENFVWCSCKAFFFTKRMCKHLALTAGVYCERCRVLSAKKGKLCHDCDMTINHFLKPSSGAVPALANT